MRAGRQKDGAVADRAPQACELGMIDGWRRGIDLDVARDDDIRRPEALDGTCDLGVLRKHGRKARKQRSAELGELAPAVDAPRRHSGVDEHKWNLSLCRFENEVRPDIGFRENRQGRFPVIQKSRDVLRHVEWNELVKCPVRQSAACDAGRRRRAGRQQDVDVRIGIEEALDKWKDGVRFADARRMHPDDLACRTRAACETQPLSTPADILLALPPTNVEQQRYGGPEQRGRGAVGLERQARLGRRHRRKLVERCGPA